ncbi:hypothetical protein [Methylobrevis pamukkalensis]|uniref:Uncharacterized protein n=1 Tax=Methylobrevis pamukkalensis TaxID=1439726 RepID=A0A1E3GYK5_9HYPH|nr:hypothetical protein [Methylobrevis pamukkalensis]ODN69133.1 hypothetical protein A6302_03574 [Methylobrevis pamukkalensis]
MSATALETFGDLARLQARADSCCLSLQALRAHAAAIAAVPLAGHLPAAPFHAGRALAVFVLSVVFVLA